MKTRVLMVCLGNICRSPLAEGILKSKVDSEEVFVDSAGTGHWHVGQLPDPRSIDVAFKHGIDITNQRGRQFRQSDFNNFDYIFVMDGSNESNVLQLAQNSEDKDKVQLLLEEIFPNERVGVPDPYYGGDQGFENVFQMIDKACDKIAERL